MDEGDTRKARRYDPVANAVTTIPLEPPMRLDAGDVLLVRTDGGAVVHYDSEGNWVETQTLVEDGTP